MEGKKIFYFDLDVTLTLMCDLDLINDLWPHTEDSQVEISKTVTFFSYDLDLDPMTLILKLDLDMVKMYLHTKNEVSMLRDSKVIA